MPPPKKPKTGPTRVDAFMTSNEIEDLKRDLMTKLPLMWGAAKEPVAPTEVVEEAEDLSMWPKSRQSSPPPVRCNTILNNMMRPMPAKTSVDQQKLLAKLLHELPNPARRYLTGDRHASQVTRVTAGTTAISEPAISKLSALMVESCGDRRMGAIPAAVSLVTRMSPDTRWQQSQHHLPPHDSSSELLKLVKSDSANMDSKSRLQLMLASRKLHCRTDVAASLQHAGEPVGSRSWQQQHMPFGESGAKHTLTEPAAKMIQSMEDIKFGQHPPPPPLGGMPPELISLGCPAAASEACPASGSDQLDRLSDSSYELPSSTMDDCAKPITGISVGAKDGRQCQICDDIASGFHYGVWSCEGCKAFFKRSLQGPVDYVCPATNNCKIDKFRRKSCQACRLGKCLEMGMSKGNCRKEKGTSAQKLSNKRNCNSKDREPHDMKRFKVYNEDAISPTAISAPMPIHCLQHAPPPPSPSPVIPSLKTLPTPSPSPVFPSLKTLPTPSPCHSTPTEPYHPPMHPLVEHLLQIDPPVRMSGHDNSQPDSERHLVASIVKLADIELVDIINWAKAFPGYADFQLKDRVHLLEVCWTEVIVSGLIWRSLNSSAHNRSVGLVFAPDLHLDRERCHISRLWPTSDALLALCHSCQRLAINREEFVLIRALVLLNAEVNLQEGDDKWHSLRRRVTTALDYTVCTRRDSTTHDPNSTPRDRLAQILLLLPHVRGVAGEFFRWLSRAKDEYAGPYCELLREMIDVRSAAMAANVSFSSAGSFDR